MNMSSNSSNKKKGFGFGGFTMATKEVKHSAKLLFSQATSQSTDSSEATTLKVLPSPVETTSCAAEDDLYSPDMPTEEDIIIPVEKPKKKRKSRWDTDDTSTKPHSDEAKSHQEEDDEQDELDMYMAGIEEKIVFPWQHEEEELCCHSNSYKLLMQGSVDQAKITQEEFRDQEEETDQLEKEEVNADNTKAQRVDIEEEDDQESFFNAMKDAPMIAYPDDDDDIDYDSDGNPILQERSKIIVPLPPIDHSEIVYPEFERNFYNVHDEIKGLSAKDISDLQSKLGIKVTGANPVRPSISFAHFGFDSHLMDVIRKSEYTQPTPIQCQAVPVALSGRDIIGIAKTGSGKTAAFIWPLLTHIMAQDELKEGDGPIGLICAPTRELCQQIYSETKKFGKCYNLKSVAAYGGGSKWEQTRALQQGAEILVATPGRLIDLIKAKATNLKRVTMMIFDEADRMFDMGFEPQVRSIANQIRPDRQSLLFSATFKKKVEWLCRDILCDPIRIVIGEIGEANEDVMQIVELFKSPSEKWHWLTSHIVEFCSGGSVLIFVTKKTNSEELAKNLKEHGHELGLIHGDFDQYERNNVINQFRKQEYSILVATDVAARGLDIPSIKTVINYDVARDITTHTHRIGRTGRAGEKGVAYTLITPQDSHFTGDLVRNLEGANQQVPEKVLAMAMKNPWFKKTRFRHGSSSKPSSRNEFKPRDRPGLGHEESAANQQTIEANLLDDDEDTDEGIGGSLKAGKKNHGRTLLTSYAMTSQPAGSRLAHLKAAFSTGYGKFAKASSSASSTMDVGGHDNDQSKETMPQPSSSFAPPQQNPTHKPKKSRWGT